MKFGLVLQVTEEVDKKINFVFSEWKQKLDSFFESKDYGNDVISLVIGVTCVSPQFDQFTKVHKPKYFENKTEKHDGFSVEIIKSFEYGIKLDYNKIINSDSEETKKIIASEILNSLEYLNNLPKKIKEFNKGKFKKDLELFFEEHI